MAGFSVDKKLPNALDQITKGNLGQLKKSDKNKTAKSFEETRKVSGHHAKFDTAKAEKSFDEMIDFVIKCTLAAAKNIDPTSEDSGSSKSSEMLQTASTMAMVGSAKQQVAKMDEMLEAVKNPGYNALELQGKEVSYNNDKHFDGKTPIKFKYNINYPEQHKGGTVVTTIKIKNPEGGVIYETKGNSKLGDHEFEWDGSDKKGKKMPAGTYSIEVNGKGFRMQGDQRIDFHVDATSVSTAVVEAVEVQNGVVKKLILNNGEQIDKDQVLRIKDIKKSSATVELSPELIGNQIGLDLSKVQVVAGDMDVYFNNHIQNPGKAVIELYDNKGKLVKTIESDKIKSVGIDKLSFSQTGLETADYTVKITVDDNDKPGKSEKLNHELTSLVVGVNYVDKTVITIDENDVRKEFKPHNINSVINSISPLRERADKYIGNRITYDDSEFTFTGAFAPQIIAKQVNEDGAIISHEELRIYNKAHEMVATLKAEYNPIEYLDFTAEQLNEYIKLPVTNHWVQYGNLAQTNKAEAYRFIEQELTAGRYKFKDTGTANLFKEGFRKLQFPSWDGIFNVGDFQGSAAEAGQVFTTDRITVHAKANGELLNKDPVKAHGVVVDWRTEQSKLVLILHDGREINENQIIS